MARDDRMEFRLNGARKRRFKAATAGTGASAPLDEFVRWFLREPGAKLPERPPADTQDAVTQ